MRRNHPALKEGGVRLWLALAVFLMAGVAAGQTITWTNEAGGDFFTAGNWNPNQVPVSTDTALFNVVTSPYTVTWSSSLATNRLFRYLQGTSVFNLQGFTYVYTCTNKASQIGATTSAVDLTITNGLMKPSGGYTSIGVQNLSVYGPAEPRTVLRLLNAGLQSGYTDFGNATIIADGTGAYYHCYSGTTLGSGGILVITNGAYYLGNNNGLTIRGAQYVEGAGSRCLLDSRYDIYGSVYAANGGYLKTGNSIRVYTNGVLTLSNAALACTMGFSNYLGGVFQGSGNVTGAFWNIGGVVRPGGSNGVGTLNFVGNYFGATSDGTTNGAIEMELGGTASNQYDRMVVNGTLNATGTVTVALIDGFHPRHGDRFRIFQFTSAAGVFDAMNLPVDSAHWNLRDLYVTGEIRYLCTGSTITFH